MTIVAKENSGDVRDLVVIGAGPAGLTAAYQWAKAGGRPVVLEMSDAIGGISRTEKHHGYRFDIGGHRFFTKVGEVEQLWHEILGDDFIKVPRLSRIYYQGRYYSYPLQLANALRNLGAYESARILFSYFKWKVWPKKQEENFEDWVINRFGGRLYWHFFRTYTQKVWGIPCTEIRADWAAQRIKNLSLKKAVVTALTGSRSHGTSTLINEFDYPRLGPGMMWERCAEKVVEMGGEVRMREKVVTIEHDGQGTVEKIVVERADGSRYDLKGDHYINSMPITALVRRLSPPAPQPVLDAANALNYRDFLIVCLMVEGDDPFPDNWIYIHSPEVKVGRIQNFRSWSKEMVPDENTSSLGMEYFCHEGDGLWGMDDKDLIDLASRELKELGLFGDGSRIADGTVIRQKKAYPVYDAGYKPNLDVIREYVQGMKNIQTVGRNGMHRYNNQDHSMLTAMLAVRNLQGESHDLWNVNVERSYHEDFQVDKSGKGKPGPTQADDGDDQAPATPDKTKETVSA